MYEGGHRLKYLRDMVIRQPESEEDIQKEFD